MSGVGEARRRIYEEAVAGLRRFASESIARLRPSLVVLFGSFARDDWREGSDIDLLVVADGVPQNPLDRWDQLYTIIQGFPVDPHVYTRQEFMELLEHGRMTALDALTEGLILYAEESYMEELKRKLDEVMRSLKPRRTSLGWTLTR